MDVVASLARVLPADTVLTDPDLLPSYRDDEAAWPHRREGLPAVVVRPRNHRAGGRRSCCVATEAAGPRSCRAAPAPGFGRGQRDRRLLRSRLERMTSILDVDAADRRGRPAGRHQRGPAAAAARARPLVRAGPGVSGSFDDRRQRRDERRWAVLREVRRHARLRCSGSRSCSPTGARPRRAAGRSRASPATTSSGCSSAREGTLGIVTEATCGCARSAPGARWSRLRRRWRPPAGRSKAAARRAPRCWS